MPTRTVTVRETDKGSELVDPPAEGWGGKPPDVDMVMLGKGLQAQERSVIVYYYGGGLPHGLWLCIR